MSLSNAAVRTAMQERREKLIKPLGVESIPITQIRPNPYQPRKTFSEESLRELSHSIATYGVIQPITVRRTSRGQFELIAGERRLRAAKMAGLVSITAVVVAEIPDQESAVVALIENLQRENLNYFEEAEGYQSLIREQGFTQEELAHRLSKNQSTIANKLRILRLPRQVKEKLLGAALTERHARSLLRLHNEQAQLEMIEKIVKDGLSVKATERLVERELKHLYGEEGEDASKETLVRMRCGSGLCVNTIKKAYSKILAAGTTAEFETDEAEDYVDVKIRIYK